MGSIAISLESTNRDQIDQIAAENEHENLFEGVTDTKLTSTIDSIWPMVQGMLTNLGASGAGMIHRTLGMFSNDQFQYSLSESELTNVLDAMVAQDRLDLDGNKYIIKRET